MVREYLECPCCGAVLLMMGKDLVRWEEAFEGLIDAVIDAGEEAEPDGA